MKKILMTASVVAGIALGAISCDANHSQSAPPVNQAVNVSVQQWAQDTGLPVTRALRMELENDPAMAINDATLALKDQGSTAPVQDVDDAYVATVEQYLTVAYDESNLAPSASDQDSADKAYVVFLTALNRYGMNLTG